MRAGRRRVRATRCTRRSRTCRTSSPRVRTGRATPALVEKLRVDYYGTEVPLQQLAGFSRARAARARDLALRQGRDQGDREGDPGERPRRQPVERRRRSSGSRSPSSPSERRKELVKVVKNRAEEGRVAVRNVRRHVRQELEQLEKDGEISRGRPRPDREGAREAAPTRSSPRSTTMLEAQGEGAARGLSRARDARRVLRRDATSRAPRRRRSSLGARASRSGGRRDRDFDDDRPEPHARRGRADPRRRRGPGRGRGPATEPRPRPRSRRADAAASAPPDDVQPAAALPAAGRPTPGRRRPDPRSDRRRRRRRPARPVGPMPLPHWTEPPTGEVPDDRRRRPRSTTRGLGRRAGTQPALPRRGRRLGRDRLRRLERRAACTTRPRALGALVDVPDVDDDEEFAAEVAARAPAPRVAPHDAARVRGRGAAAAAAGRSPDRRRRDRRAARHRDARASRRRATTSPTAHHHRRRRSPSVALVAFVDRPRRHRRARHRDRRRRRVRALRGLPPRRVPARHAHRAARLAVDGAASRYNYGERAFPLVVALVVVVHAVLVPVPRSCTRRPMVERRGHHARLRLRRRARRVRRLLLVSPTASA